MTDLVRLHAFVRGKVQGVRFRMFTLEASAKYKITGWVRNRYGGSVELMAEGEKIELENFLDLLKIGPSMSNVEKIEREWLPATGEFAKFKIRMTR
jgi:acylphosphatase